MLNGIYGTDQTANATIELLSAENYFQKDGETDTITNETEEIDTEGNTYISVIPVDKITQGYKNYVRLYFKWINDEDKNEADSQLASNATIVDELIQNEKLSVPLQVNLKQYTGEVIGNETE